MTNGEKTTRGRIVLVPLILAAAGTIAYALWVLDDYGFMSDPLGSWMYDASIALAGLACVLRSALFRELRWAWLCFGLGLWCWAAGDVYWVQELSLLKLKNIPYPSWADAGYLLSIPFFFAGTGLLIKQRVGRFTIERWFDGTIAALAAAALVTAFLAPALIGLTDGDPATVLTNLAYPIGDVIVLSFILAALVLSGIRGAGAFLMVGTGSADLVRRRHLLPVRDRRRDLHRRPGGLPLAARGGPAGRGRPPGVFRRRTPPWTPTGHPWSRRSSPWSPSPGSWSGTTSASFPRPPSGWPPRR